MFKTLLPFILITAGATSAHSALFRAETTGGKTNAGTVNTFLSEVEALLPPQMRSEIKGTILLKFSKMGKGALTNPPCPGDKAPKNLPVYAKHLLGGANDKPVVELNEQFLDVIIKGESAAATSTCGHRNLYRLAKATLIHEVAHIYDLRTGRKFQGAFAKEYAKNKELCDKEALNQAKKPSEREGKRTPLCAYYQGVKTRVSDSRPYLNTIGWEVGMDIERRGLETSRSPDPYEGKDQREHFAVNMEFFLMDSEYQCRRPLLNTFLKEEFNFTPYAENNCQVETKLPYSFSPIQVNLDPQRIYEIHYLLAGVGEGISSRFGHSMFRIIGCAPQHAVGPECLKDFAYHHVVSFRANILDMLQSNLAGLTGSYPSQLFLYPFAEIMNEYNMKENRDLLSYPLRLTEEKKVSFINRVLEMYWQYSGSYYFLSNNCATESAYFMQGVFPEKHMVPSGVVMPYGLVDTFADLKWIDASIPEGKDALGVYFFPRFEAQLGNLVEKLNKVLRSNEEVSIASLQKMNTKQRWNTSQRLLKKYPESKNIILGTILAIELKMKDREFANLQSKYAEVLQRADKGEFPEIRKLRKQSVGMRVAIQPWKTTTQGYGIASVSDRMSSELVDKNQIEVAHLSNETSKLIEKVIPEAYLEVREIVANIQNYLKLLK